MSTPALVLENQPVCNICYNKPSDPVKIPCQHQFCRSCIKQYVINCPEADKFKGFGCPVCQEFVQKPIMAGSRPKEQWAEYLPTVNLSDRKPDLLSGQNDDLKCAACREAGLQKMATLWCQQCNDAYCPECSASHRNFPSTRSHAQVPIAYISPRDRKSNESQTCPQHRDSKVEFYCAACDTLICPSCAFVNHRKCEKVATISGASNVAKGELSNKIQRVRKRSTECQSMLSDSNTMIRELQVSRERTEASIKGFSDQLTQTIAENRDNMLSNISHSFNTEESRLQTTKAKLQDHIVELEGCEQSIENVLNSPSEAELLSKLGKTKRLYDASLQKVIEPAEIVPIKVDFEPNTSLLDVLDSSQLGETIVGSVDKEKPRLEKGAEEQVDQLKSIKIKAKERKTSKQKVKFKKSKRSKRRGSGSEVLSSHQGASSSRSEKLKAPKQERVRVLQKHKTITTDIPGDSLKSSTTSIVVLFVNGVLTIVVADHNNYALKSFYTSMNIDRQSKMSVDSKPCHVAKLGNNTVVATMKRLKKIVVVKVSPTLTMVDRIRTSKHYNCITALADDRLAVSTTLEAEVSIDIIDLEGQILHSIVPDPEEHLLFSEPKYLTVTPSGTLMMADKDVPYITNFTQAGKLLFKTGPKQTADLEGMHGFFCSEDEELFIPDKKNNRIIILQEDGEEITTFLTAEDGIDQPQGVFIDDLYQIYVCQANSKITIFKEVEIAVN
ncbi:hypothetical protein LOTGIDRAFT_170455 [Lottia gigantea]|uniref:RING-type domain-containing protein n=1 Tax=Lottia gigantea TaxID=225164 RepID=V3ZHY1_LOTGI|nr:hypothetical protein LOTGIDRAFT_170455 [Lottia gigantea]ESO81910.1 hypothetical protein LOTGIDRAFT_170455 [Lottia gigantea]